MSTYVPFTDFSIKGKVALITGAASGIGRAAALLFAARGADLALLDLKEDVKTLAAELKSKHGVKALGIACDITDQAAAGQALDTAVATFGRVDILLNVAGVALLGPALEVPESEWDTVLNINLKALFMMAQRVGKVMKEQGGGKIVNVASQAGIIALDRHVAYAASKAAVIGVTKVLALEWAQYNIQVNAISPTVVLTELGEKAWAGEVGEAMKRQIPAGRFAMPDEIAAAMLFLCSDGANMITGENMLIDGGYTIK